MLSKNPPFFSIVIPVYNRAEFIPGLLETVFGQTFVDFEVIVVDDGSTDGTAQVISKISDPRLRYFKIENRERAAARNYGAKMAVGRYLNFFDSDDRMLSHHLSTAFEFCNDEGHPKWFHTGYALVSEAGNTISIELGEVNDAEKRLIETNYLGCDSVFIERSFFLQNQFNNDRRLASSEDWELWLRIISREEILACQKITFHMVHHANRSLLTISPDRIIERDKLMLDSLMKDQIFRAKFSSYIKIFAADRYTFFALSLVLANRKKESLAYILKSFITTPRVLQRRRFWACLKLFLFT